MMFVAVYDNAERLENGKQMKQLKPGHPAKFRSSCCCQQRASNARTTKNLEKLRKRGTCHLSNGTSNSLTSSLPTFLGNST